MVNTLRYADAIPAHSRSQRCSRPGKRTADQCRKQSITFDIGRLEMKPSDFAAITQNIIRNQGFDDFAPVACFPERREIRALADVPEDEDIEATAINWGQSLAKPGEEFLIAFKHSPTEFKVIRLEGSDVEQEMFLVQA